MDLQQRVERLEYENRRLKLIGLALLFLIAIAILALLGIGQPHHAYAQEKKRADADFGVISAQKICLVDENGRLLGRLSCDRTGSALYLYDSAGQAGVVLLADNDGHNSRGNGYIGIKYANKTVITLDADTKGGSLKLWDKNGKVFFAKEPPE